MLNIQNKLAEENWNQNAVCLIYMNKIKLTKFYSKENDLE